MEPDLILKAKTDKLRSSPGPLLTLVWSLFWPLCVNYYKSSIFLPFSSLHLTWGSQALWIFGIKSWSLWHEASAKEASVMTNIIAMILSQIPHYSPNYCTDYCKSSNGSILLQSTRGNQTELMRSELHFPKKRGTNTALICLRAPLTSIWMKLSHREQNTFKQCLCFISLLPDIILASVYILEEFWKF